MSNLIKLNLKEGWDINSRTNEPKAKDLPIGIFAKNLRKIPNLRFNQLTKKVEVDGKPIESNDLDLLYIDIQEKGWDIGKIAARDAFVRQAKKDQYHPIREYLEFVEKADIEEINPNKLATSYLGTNAELYDAMLKATLIGAVKRIFDNGCQFDYVCVLKGQQGIKKSTFWKILSGGHFNSSMPSGEGKDLLQLIGTTWFFGLEELDSVTKSFMSGKLKNLITSREDNYRPPYGSSPDKFPRSSIFVGTTNSDIFLCDETGSRRFWTIELPQNYSFKGETLPIMQLEKDRDGIFKGIMKCFRDGEQPMLPMELERQSRLENSKYRDDHPFKYQALERIKTRKSASCFTPFTAREIFSETTLRTAREITKEDLRQMGIVLKELGCTKAKRKNGERYWEIPQEWSLDEVQ